MDKQLDQIHLIMETFNTIDIDSRTDFVQIEEDIIITISSIYNQQHNTYTNISSIDFGDCEGNIKKKYNLPQNSTIYVLKIDVFIAGNKIPKVEYELYYPFNGKNFTLLDISVCENDIIDIYIPINISSDELGKYDPESDFFNDVCTSKTSENGTDKPLVDRREDFINNNLTICEEDCSISMYDESQNKVKCSCLIKTKIPLLSDIKIDKKRFLKNFVDIKNLMNINLIKCIHLLFNLENLFYNSANYMDTFLFIFSFIAIIVFTQKSYIGVKDKIKTIFEQRKKEIQKKEDKINPNNNNNKIKYLIKKQEMKILAGEEKHKIEVHK